MKRALCPTCERIAAQPHASHHPSELRLTKIDYAFLGSRDGTGAAVAQRHFVCEVCATRWVARPNPDGTCCDWRQV